MTTPILTLDQLVEVSIKYAEAKLIGKADTQVPPFFHVQFNDRPPSIMLAPWTDERQKEAFIAAMRLSFEDFKDSVVSYSFMSEAWQAVEDRDHPTGLAPADREDKREVVMINACDRAESRLMILDIQRDNNGRVTALTAAPDQLAGVTGRLFNLMEDET